MNDRTGSLDDSATHEPVKLRRGYADTVLGQLHYAEMGRGPAILLLHQTPRSADEFAELMPLLATSHRAIAMDMLGFGLSAAESDSGEQSIEGMAAGAIALLDALGVEQCHLLGHHTGGAVAIQVAANHPGRVARLVLSSAPWTGAGDDDGDGPNVDKADDVEDGSHLTTLWGQRSPYYPAGRPDLLNRYIRDALSPGVNPYAGHVACARYKMDRHVKNVHAPTLLLGAEDDPFALPNVERLRENLVNAAQLEVSVIPGGMIPLMEQKAPEVAKAVLAFLQL